MPKSSRRRARGGASYLPPPAKAGALGFASQLSLISFVVLGAVLIFAPRLLSGFWPTDYDYLPQALFAGVTACTCVVMALRPRSGLADPVGRPAALRSPLLLVTAAFFVWQALSAATTVYLHDTLIELSRILTCCAWFFIVRALLAESHAVGDPAAGAAALSSVLRLLLFAITLGALVESVPAVYSYLHDHTSGQMGTFYNYNLFANFCAMSLPLALALALHGAVGEPDQSPPGAAQGKPAPAALLAIQLGLLTALVLALALLQTASKGGFLAALCGALAFGIAVVHAQRARVAAVLKARPLVTSAIALVLLAGAGAVARKTLLPRLQSATGSEAYSWIFRAYTWRGTLHMAMARPLLGFGAGCFTSAYTKYAITGYTRSAHNVWLQIAAEAGFPAMLLLLTACLLGCRAAWRALRGPHWAVAAGMLGAVMAFGVHGCIDAGWSETPITLLLCVVLAALACLAPPLRPGAAPPAPRRTPRSQLRFEWLLSALLLGAAAYVGERAAGGESSRADAEHYIATSSLTQALQSAIDATQSDPLGVRTYTALARAREYNGLSADSAYSNAIQLSPLNAQMYLLMAEYRVRVHQAAGGFYDKAVECDPNDSTTLLERGQYRLAQNDKGGWEDFKRIAALQNQPYGKYPATPENVNMDVVRALFKLAERAIEQHDKYAARAYLAQAAPLLKLAHDNYQARLQSAKAMQGSAVEVQFPEKLDAFDAQFEAMKEKTK